MSHFSRFAESHSSRPYALNIVSFTFFNRALHCDNLTRCTNRYDKTTTTKTTRERRLPLKDDVALGRTKNSLSVHLISMLSDVDGIPLELFVFNFNRRFGEIPFIKELRPLKVKAEGEREKKKKNRQKRREEKK